VGRVLNVKDFDLERLFMKDGVQIVHLSGLIAALSHETSEFCLEIARFAKKHGTVISFDLNYRASFWEGREDELRKAFTEIASLSDILIGNEEDYQLCLGVQGPAAGGENIEDAIGAFKGMILNANRAFPNVKVFANTLREVISANEHLWGAIVYENERWHEAPLRTINVIDRIGGGDGFVGGLLYSILKGMDPEKWIQFAWASGALATTFLTDYAQPADENVIWSIWEGNARVKR
jgi:2-dehydro-3-deoxygluconokinase